jgi:hypothetical protein
MQCFPKRFVKTIIKFIQTLIVREFRLWASGMESE